MDSASLAVITATLALVSGLFLALLNSWISARAGIDEGLRAERLRVYPALWQTTGAISRWPRRDVSRSSLSILQKDLRAWYFGTGGLFLSEVARDRYYDVQKLIETLLLVRAPEGAEDAEAEQGLTDDRYKDLMDTSSALRTALAEDLNVRRRPSRREIRRRREWHDAARRKAKARRKRAAEDPRPFGGGPVTTDAGN